MLHAAVDPLPQRTHRNSAMLQVQDELAQVQAHEADS